MSEWDWRGTGREGYPTLATMGAKPRNEETRQEYANARIAEFQRAHPDAQFSSVLSAFRYYGIVYDQGFRLRDEQAGAA